MAKTMQTQRAGQRKAVAALTLAVLLILSAAFGFFGVKGQKLDSMGLYKMLPWIPTPTSRFEWREALTPGADFGANTVYTYTVEGGADALQETAKALSKRLAQLRLSGAALEQTDSALQLTLPDQVLSDESIKLLTSVGDYAFADPSGADFLPGTHIVKAAVSQDPNGGASWLLSFELDAESKQIFADKTAELIGQSMMLKKDGVTLVQPGIQQALTEGGASIPGFTFEQAYMHSLLMQSGKLPYALRETQRSAGAPLMGEGALKGLVMGMWVSFAAVALYLIIRHRMLGFVGAWALALGLGFSWLFAALLKMGFTVSTFMAVMAAFVLAVGAALVLFAGMKKDLSGGRSGRQALKDAYASVGHIPLDAFAALLLTAVVLIIVDSGAIGQFMRMFAVALIVQMAAIHVLLRVMLSETFYCLGDQTALYAAKHSEKEAV